MLKKKGVLVAEDIFEEIDEAADAEADAETSAETDVEASVEDEEMMDRVRKLRTHDARAYKRGVEYLEKLRAFGDKVESGIVEIRDEEFGISKRCAPYQKIVREGLPVFCMKVYVDGRYVYKESWRTEDLYEMHAKAAVKFVEAI